MSLSSPKNLQTKRGSVLVFTVVILFLLLTAALSVATVTVSESKSAITLNRSTKAYQIAESGAEIIFERIYGTTYDTSPLSSLAPSGATCANGEISANFSDGRYRVSLYDSDGERLTICSSTSWREDAESLRAVGSYGGAIRAVKVDIDPLPPTP